MGAGKTTVGRILAARWQVEFQDLDALVGDIPAIVAAEGEPGLRRRETATLRAAVRRPGVLALGGGTVAFAANMELLRGWAVFVLSAPLAVLRARIGDGRGRPLASRLEALLAERAEAYARAGGPIETGGISPEQVADEIEAQLR